MDPNLLVNLERGQVYEEEGLPGTPGRVAPPNLHPQYYPQPHTSKPGADVLHLLKYLEESRRCDEQRRLREDEERRKLDEERRLREEEDRRERKELEELGRQEEKTRRDEENARFTTLIQMLAPAQHQPSDDSTVLSTGATASQSAVGLSNQPFLPPPQKVSAQTPPPLKPDATFQMFREWRRRWDDYAVMVDLSKLNPQKQMIQMRMCLTLETQRVLEQTLQTSPSTNMTVDEVLDALQLHIKGLRN